MRGWSLEKATRYSPEVRERAVRMVADDHGPWEGTRLPAGRNPIHRGEVWLLGLDPAQLGPA
jgi:hypothetical protein